MKFTKKKKRANRQTSYRDRETWLVGELAKGKHVFYHQINPSNLQELHYTLSPAIPQELHYTLVLSP